MKPMPMLPLFAIVLIGASGCGLSDYQTRLDAQRERVQAFDEANRLLDDPIEIPTILLPKTKDTEAREGRAWPFEIYLRLPNGYRRAKDKDPYRNFFFRYTGGTEGAYAIFIAAAGVAAEPKAEEGEPKEEEAPPFGYYTAKDFRTFIKPSLDEYCLKAGLNLQASLKEKTKPDTKYVKPLTPYPDAPGAMKVAYAFHTLTDEEHPKLTQYNAFDVYLHERNNRQVCIVVHRPLQTNGASLRNAVEACLGSLDVSGDAMNKRAEYRKAKGMN